MRLVFNELSPKDRYLARGIRPLSLTEMGYITHLYLPLIGVESYTLYQVLAHEVEERNGAVGEGTHRGLMLITSLSLDRLLAARERLEALGLLEVRRRENRDRDYFYEYIVKPPLSPYQFFQEEIWSVMLLNKVERHRFEQLRQKYADRRLVDLEEAYPYEENLTKPFYEVYHSLSTSELEVRQGSETDHFFQRMEASYPAAPQQNDYLAEPSPTLDLSFVRLNLPSHIEASDVLTSETVSFFYQLLHFYQLSSWLLGQELRDWNLYTTDGQLDRVSLRRRLREKYVDGRLSRDVVSPADIELSPGELPEPGSVSHARICRSLSPLTLLELAVGGRVSKAFLERAEALVFTDGLSPEVANVLLLHALRETQMELPRSYLETVRDSWKAKQISTVDEAVQVILERTEAKQQAQEKAKNRKESTTASRRGGRSVPQDKLPASVQRQMEREQEREKAAQSETTPIEQEEELSVMDIPELRALLESIPKSQKGGKR
ncbi:DnaD domain protein [Brevibacillus humidisoli]|uniref:DnaD domain protein n=1 Tax=Brevibacillus humidisoli TaxID=2895522 RepID=UPI001E54A196|nr:DnaD domain protein [Brevibacillus humidisoli]UFJ41552.1 DnaD domain protein [Brevibacillus humidisoli]